MKKISNKESDLIGKTLSDLDIRLDTSGNIKKEDIICLLFPTLYNIDLLNEKVMIANNLSTYVRFKTSKHSRLKENITESEIYPSSDLQSDNSSIKGSIPLSDRQKERLKKNKIKA